MEKKSIVGKILGRALLTILLLFGLFAFLIVSHESYHYFTVDGNAQGICFGNCATHGGAMMVSGVYFDHINTDKTDINENERQAWQFSLAFTGLLGIFSFYSLAKYGL
ncbi:MAG TPA: hypothetical protein VJK03_00570 [Candidatus Nanoarchaeia archaeon]|nr:hypothetical protein [Candidatus Nanoarchaeia archaeon]